MKFIFNQGPWVDEQKHFQVPNKGMLELTTYMLEWYNLLPQEFQNHIESITVVPNKSHEQKNLAVTVKVHGVYESHNQNGNKERHLWHAHATESVSYYEKVLS